MCCFKELLNKKTNITKYKLGASVPPNKKAQKIMKKVTDERNHSKRKWL